MNKIYIKSIYIHFPNFKPVLFSLQMIFLTRYSFWSYDIDFYNSDIIRRNQIKNILNILFYNNFLCVYCHSMKWYELNLHKNNRRKKQTIKMGKMLTSFQYYIYIYNYSITFHHVIKVYRLCPFPRLWFVWSAFASFSANFTQRLVFALKCCK